MRGRVVTHAYLQPSPLTPETSPANFYTYIYSLVFVCCQPGRIAIIASTLSLARLPGSSKRLAPLSLLILLLLGFSLPATAQLAGQMRTGPTHQDWQVLCEQTPQGGENCFISQAIADEEGDPVMQVSVGRVDAESVIVIHLPLGLDLRYGILLEIGQNLQRELPYQVCLPEGCRVVGRADDEILAAMRAGRTFEVVLVPFGANQPVVIQGSLMGFTAGYRAVTQ